MNLQSDMSSGIVIDRRPLTLIKEEGKEKTRKKKGVEEGFLFRI